MGLKEEYQKVREMNAAQRWNYFLSYYVWKTLAVLGGLAAIIFLCVHFAVKEDLVMGILAVNADGENVTAADPTYFDDFLREHGIDTKENTVNLNYTMYIDANSQENIDETNLQTIQTLFMTRSVDVFLADPDFFQAMAGAGYLADLNAYLSEDLLAEYEDQLLYVVNVQTQQRIAAGVHLDLEHNDWLRETGWYDEQEVVVGLAAGMKDERLAVSMLEDILEK